MGTGVSGVAFQAKQALASQHDTLDELKKAQLVPDGWEYIPGNYSAPDKLGKNLSGQLNGTKLVEAEFASEIDPAAQPLYDAGFKLIDRLMGRGAPKEPPKLQGELEGLASPDVTFSDGTRASGNSQKGQKSVLGAVNPAQRGMIPTEVRGWWWWWGGHCTNAWRHAASGGACGIPCLQAPPPPDMP